MLFRLISSFPLVILANLAWGKVKTTTPVVSEPFALLSKTGQSKVEIDLLVSVYRSEQHFESLAKNILDFENLAAMRFIFLLSNPSETEIQNFSRLTSKLPNSVLYSTNERVGIYQTWNFGIKMSESPIISNLNVDDLRSPKFLERVMSVDEDWDVLYTDYFEHRSPLGVWGDVRNGVLKRTGEPTISNLAFKANYPHAAPFWKRAIHETVGMFDESYLSNADQKFWLDALANGRNFIRLSEPLYAYYRNPKGISTKILSPKRLETFRVLFDSRQSIKADLKALKFRCN